jgi:hypothetical protein
MDEFENAEAPVAGGLSQAAPAPVAAPFQAPAPQPSEYEKAMAAYQKQKQELLSTQQRLIQSLESRVAGPSEMLFALSSAFGRPTRTGSFGESFGYATEALGQFQGQQRQQMSDIAKMRLDLQMQELGMKEKDLERVKRDQAFNLIGEALGSTPSQASEAIGGILDADQASKLIRIYPQIARFDKDAAAALKNSFEMTSELRKQAQEDMKNGMQYAELRMKYPPQIMSYFPQNVVDRFKGPQAGPSSPSNQQSQIFPGQITEGGLNLSRPTREEALQTMRHLDAAGIPARVNVAPPVGQVSQPSAQPAPIAPPQPAAAQPAPVAQAQPIPTQRVQQPPFSEEDQLSPVEKSKLIADRAAKRDEEFKAQRASITSWTPQTVGNANVELNELDMIASRYPRLFNILGGSGYFNALAKAANDGAQAGRLGTFSLPVANFIRAANLNEKEKIAAARVEQILGNQFFLNAKDNKSVLGPSISNADVMLLKAPLATIDNPAPFIQFWARQNTLLNNQRRELYDSFMNYEKSIGSGAPMGSFFMPNGPFTSISDKYNRLYQRLVREQPAYGVR